MRGENPAEPPLRSAYACQSLSPNQQPQSSATGVKPYSASLGSHGPELHSHPEFPPKGDTLYTGRRIRLGVLACSAFPLNSQSIPLEFSDTSPQQRNCYGTGYGEMV